MCWFRRYSKRYILETLLQKVDAIMTDTSLLVAAAARSKVATDKLLTLTLDLQSKLAALDPAGAAKVQADIDGVVAILDGESAAEEGAVNPAPAPASTGTTGPAA